MAKKIARGVKDYYKGPMKLYCDNKAAINISNNPIQND